MIPQSILEHLAECFRQLNKGRRFKRSMTSGVTCQVTCHDGRGGRCEGRKAVVVVSRVSSLRSDLILETSMYW